MNNTSGGDGGAITVYATTLAVEGEPVFTGNNAAFDGGGIAASDSIVTFQGEPSFANNSAGDNGGGIAASDSIVTFQGEPSFEYNSAGEDGGAIAMSRGTVTFEGQTSFVGNIARLAGGSIKAWSGSLLAFEGETSFIDNRAQHGGAIAADRSNITFDGETSLADNSAIVVGGAIRLYTSDVMFTGETAFTGNSAGGSGGAVAINPSESDKEVSHPSYMSSGHSYSGPSTESDSDGSFEDGYRLTNVIIHGTTVWTGNRAGVDGGAISGQTANIVINSINTSFANNSAGGNGGALKATNGAFLSIENAVSFQFNRAESNGGAIAAIDTEISVEGSAFISNTATFGAGGGIYCSTSVASFNGSLFTANTAELGGGLGLFSTGSAWSKDQPGPANTTGCAFERNTATDGGGIYTADGYDIIQDCRFEDNLAGGSGGAYLHSGIAVSIKNCVFVRNGAADEGLAILSLGLAKNITGVEFDSNNFYCSPGTYGVDVPETESAEDCRFDVVCSRCASSCGEIPPAITVNKTSIPTCKPVMVGAATDNAGATLEKLELKGGYYRTSSISEDILQCHRAGACVGGSNATQYCASGYRDVYCAVCEQGYGSGYQYSCSGCDGKNKSSLTATAVAILVVALLVIALAISELVAVVHEQTNTETAWKTRVYSCRTRIVDAVPLTAIKIILVAWQIMTQFSSVTDVVYPDVWEKFLSVLNLVNFELGLIPSISCVMNVNFYGRLLFATIAPAVVLGSLALTYTVARSRNKHSPEGLQAVRGKHLSVALFVLFLVYSSVSFTVFQTFVCEKLDDKVSYLRADYSLTCSTNAHKAWMAYASAMIFVYPIGIPAFFAWWLVSNRRDLVRVGSAGSSYQDRLQPMRDLWEPYKPSRYYYEVVECGRRIVLTGLGAFLFPGSAAQVALEVLFAAAFIAISEMLSPFRDPVDAWLYRSGMWVVFLSMFLALMLRVDLSDENSQSQEIFAKLLIAANVGLVFAVVVQTAVSARKGLGVSPHDLPVSKKSSRSLSFAQVCDEDVEGDHDLRPAWDQAPTTRGLPG